MTLRKSISGAWKTGATSAQPTVEIFGSPASANRVIYTPLAHAPSVWAGGLYIRWAEKEGEGVHETTWGVKQGWARG